MVNLNNGSSPEEAELTDFLFILTETEDQIVLKGINGAAWSELGFIIFDGEQQAFNESGIVRD